MANQIVWCDIPVLDLDRAIRFYSPSPNTSQLAARMKARRTLRSHGEGGRKGFGEFRKDTSELGSEELHSPAPNTGNRIALHSD
jgi:predicted enzyme related to lactoylglutathione lyase